MAAILGIFVKTAATGLHQITPQGDKADPQMESFAMNAKANAETIIVGANW